jgi:hypothetical protein
MPRVNADFVPSHYNHKATGQAEVTLNGRAHHLGKWKSPASRAEYERLITEWLANGRRLHDQPRPA